MQAQAYYRLLNANDNDIADNAKHLVVNFAGLIVPPHPFRTWNPYGRKDYYLMYVIRGTLEIGSGTHEEDTKYLHTGELFVFPPRTAYHYEPAGGSDEEIAYYCVHFTGYGAARLLSDCAIPIGAVRRVGQLRHAEDAYRELFHAFIVRTPCFEITAAAAFTQICAMFGDALLGIAEEKKMPEEHAGQIYTSLSYLHENLNKPITVAMLAEMEHLSVSRYRTLFISVTGVTPIAYITKLRISHACELLAQTSLPLSDIAAAVGYLDPQYFSRIFHAQVGMAPSEYRKGARET